MIRTTPTVLMGSIALVVWSSSHPSYSQSAEGIIRDGTDAPSTQSDNAVLETLAGFIFAFDQQLAFNLGSCENTYRTRLLRIQGWQDVESSMAGVTDHAVAAAIEHCQRHIPPVLEHLRRVAKDQISKTFTSSEQSRLYPALAPTVEKLQAIRFEFRPGDTAADVVTRAGPAFDAALAGLDQRLMPIISTRDGRSIEAKLPFFQSAASTVLEKGQKEITPVLLEAVRRGNLAANSFAKARGFPPIFDQP